MFVIIEGPDCVGKTTAAEKLATADGWSYVHMDKPPESFDHFAGYANQLAPRRVFDRFHLGALAYGQLATDERQCITRHQLQMTARLIKFYGGIVVVMYAGSDSWMTDQLSEHKRRDELYAYDVIMNANAVYRWLAGFKGHYDQCLGMALVDVAHDVSTLGWPTDAQLELWAEMAGHKLAFPHVSTLEVQ